MRWGRVPLFADVLQIPLIHALAVVTAYLVGSEVAWLFGGFPPEQKPEEWGFSLAGVYAVWMGIIMLLHPLCVWFQRVKQLHRDSWLRYA